MNAGLLDIKKKVEPILREARVRRAALFGSYARGEQTERSDVDILVEYPDSYTLFDVVALRNALEQVLGKPVDLVSYNTIKPRLRTSVLTENVSII